MKRRHIWMAMEKSSCALATFRRVNWVLASFFQLSFHLAGDLLGLAFEFIDLVVSDLAFDPWLCLEPGRLSLPFTHLIVVPLNSQRLNPSTIMQDFRNKSGCESLCLF